MFCTFISQSKWMQTKILKTNSFEGVKKKWGGDCSLLPYAGYRPDTHYLVIIINYSELYSIVSIQYYLFVQYSNDFYSCFYRFLQYYKWLYSTTMNTYDISFIYWYSFMYCTYIYNVHTLEEKLSTL